MSEGTPLLHGLPGEVGAQTDKHRRSTIGDLPQPVDFRFRGRRPPWKVHGLPPIDGRGRVTRPARPFELRAQEPRPVKQERDETGSKNEATCDVLLQPTACRQRSDIDVLGMPPGRLADDVAETQNPSAMGQSVWSDAD